MKEEIKKEMLDEVISKFEISGEVQSCQRYGNGHINDTFSLVCKETSGNRQYILQKINRSIFKNPEQLMHNISQVTDHLRSEIEKDAGDPLREVITIIPTKDKLSFYRDALGDYWRMYLFITDAICYEKAETKDLFYQSAVAFGKFQKRLQYFDASCLYEAIPDFHNTPLRYQRFLEVVELDRMGRVKEAALEIEFFIQKEKEMKLCKNYLDEKKLPLRVTHNDTKLNNVMIDKSTGKGICVIDLDTVMPGLSIYDFGDSIRFGANTAEEDERDLSKVSLNLELFEQYTKGFLEGCEGSLTDTEIYLLPYGAKTMTLECGMRFLADYLEGDVYFKTHRDRQNLDRCRTQIELVRDMERKWKQIEQIMNQYLFNGD